MRLFIDTGSVAEVEEVAAWGVLAGATTNPSLLAKEGRDPGAAIVRICELVDGPVSAEAGATYVSCFLGRLDDISVDSAQVLAEIVGCLRPAGATAQVLAASIRHPEHVVTAAKLGCDVATLPAKVLRQMLEHPLTSAGIERFAADWRSRPEFGEWLHALVAGGPVRA